MGVIAEFGISVGSEVWSGSVIDRQVNSGVRTSVGRVIFSGVGSDVDGKITSLMIHLKKSCKEGSEYGKIDGLLNWMPPGKYYITVLVSSIIVVDGEVHISKV